jgi:hypothetical protein
MDSLTTTISLFDDMNIICDIHNIPSIGICGDYFCRERKFFCLKCVKQDDTCITSSKHELVSLSELLYRFFLKQETKSIDLIEINSMMETLKLIDRMEINKNISDFIKNCQNNVSKVTDDLIFNMREEILSANNTNSDNMKNLISKNYDFDQYEFILKGVPLILINSSPDEIKTYIKSNEVKLQEKEYLIKFLKLVYNYEEVNKFVSSIDDLTYLEKLTEEYLKEVEDKFDHKLNELQNTIYKKIEEVEDSLIPPKDNVVIMLKHSLPKFITNPNDLIYKYDITDQAHKSNSIDNVFCAFKTLKGDYYVVWGTPTYNIIVYDLRLETQIKSFIAHTSTIFSCRHYVDKKDKQDLLISSSYDRSVKVWNVKDWSNIINIQTAHNGYYIYSVCILSDELEHKNYIISAAPNEYTKIWDFSSKFIREFGVSNESTYFINTWLDSKNKKYYVINANSVDVKVYHFNTGLLYRSFKGTPNTWHMSALVNEIDNLTQLIESDGNGNVRIWDFYQGTLLKTIASSGINLRGVCLWNDQYLFASGSDYNVKLYDLKNGIYLKKYDGHTSTCCAVEKIVHPKYGECLISHALDGKLKLWINKTNK